MTSCCRAQLLPSYLEQSEAVRARFERAQAARSHSDAYRICTRCSRAASKRTLALKDIDLTTHRREFLCVVGPSGCGKSTLVRILAGLEQHSCGRGSCCRDSPSRGPGSDRGMVFQGYTLFPWLTVKKNVMFGLEVNGAGRLEASAKPCSGWS